MSAVLEKWGATAKSPAAMAATLPPRSLKATQQQVQQVAKSPPAARAGSSSGDPDLLQLVAPASCPREKLQKTGTASDKGAASATLLGLAAAAGSGLTSGGRGTPARPSAVTQRQLSMTSVAATAGIAPSPPQADASRSPNILAAAVAALLPQAQPSALGYSSVMAEGALSQGQLNPQLSEAASPQRLSPGVVTDVPADPEEQQGDEESDLPEQGQAEEEEEEEEVQSEVGRGSVIRPTIGALYTGIYTVSERKVCVYYSENEMMTDT